jgi:hypothetical protein
VQRKRLASDTSARQGDLGRLETGIAHQPTEHPVPKRAVPATGDLRGELAEAEAMHAVDGDRHGPSITRIAQRQERHRLAAFRFSNRVFPQHQRPRFGRADDVRAGHRRQLVTQQPTQRGEHRRGPTDRRRAWHHIRQISRGPARVLAEIDR